MKGFQQDGTVLLWERNHEKMRIDPWGTDSLRVRATMEPQIQMDLPGGLLDPAQTSAQIEIGPAKAVIRNGDITAEVPVFRSRITSLDVIPAKAGIHVDKKWMPDKGART